MADYICPNCRGGFNEGPLNDGCCPWCGQSLDGSYDSPTVHAVSKVRTDDGREEMGGPIYQRLIGWLE